MSVATKPGIWAAAKAKNFATTKGKGRVYLDFLKKIHREVSGRGKTMMFWGDIILKYPKLIPELANLLVAADVSRLTLIRADLQSAATNDLIALNWGYEANHPFEKEAARFAKAKIPFYVCPGTSTWQTLIGRHDNALANLRAAAKAGTKARRHRLSHHRLGRRRPSAAAGRELADVSRRRVAGLECKGF